MRCGVFLSDVRTVGKTKPDQIKRLSSVKRKQSVPELVRRPVQRPPCVFLAYSGGFPVSRIHLRIIRQREQPVSYSCAQGLIRLQGHNISEADLMVEKRISRKKDFLGREIITERSRAMARNGDDRHVQSAEADHSGLQGLNPEITDSQIEILCTVAEDFPVADILLSGENGKICLFLPSRASGHVIEMKVCAEECPQSQAIPRHNFFHFRRIVRRIHENGVRVLPHEVGVGVQNAVNKRTYHCHLPPGLMPGRPENIVLEKQAIQKENRQWRNRKSENQPRRRRPKWPRIR